MVVHLLESAENDLCPRDCSPKIHLSSPLEPFGTTNIEDIGVKQKSEDQGKCTDEVAWWIQEKKGKLNEENHFLLILNCFLIVILKLFNYLYKHHFIINIAANNNCYSNIYLHNYPLLTAKILNLIHGSNFQSKQSFNLNTWELMFAQFTTIFSSSSLYKFYKQSGDRERRVVARLNIFQFYSVPRLPRGSIVHGRVSDASGKIKLERSQVTFSSSRKQSEGKFKVVSSAPK